jgi:hypothetical protein
MRSRALLVAAFVLISILSPAGVRAFDVNDVLKLQKEQVSDSLIALAIQNSYGGHRWPVYGPYLARHARYPFRRW